MRAKVGPALHLDALTLVTRLHLLALCRLAVRRAQRRCPPPVPAGPGGRPRMYAEESLLLLALLLLALLLLALLRTWWRLSSQDLHDWLVEWPALVRACGLPCDRAGRVRVPSPAQQGKRGQRAGAPLDEMRCVVRVSLARRTHLVGGHDVVIDSAPILAWRRADPDAAVGPAPHHHARPFLRGYRVHSVLFPALSRGAVAGLCRGSGLPLRFLSPLATSLTLPVPVRSGSGRSGCMTGLPASSASTPASGA
jgi:hypothetical protein